MLKFSLITEFSFLLQMLLFHVTIAVYLFLWTVMSFCWLWDKSYIAVFDWFSRAGIVSVSWNVIRILATLIPVCLSFSKYQLLESWYFVEVLVLFLLIMKFPVAWGKTLQIRAKHTLEISSENTNQKNPSFSFLNIRLGQGKDRIMYSKASLEEWFSVHSNEQKMLSLTSTATFLPYFMALFNTYSIMIPKDSSVAKHKLPWIKCSLPWEGLEKILLLFKLRN